MKSFKLSTAFSILALALMTACSNSERSPSNTPPPNREVAQKFEKQSDLNLQSTKTATQENVGDDSTHITRSADSHTHGDAQLAIVLEKGAITIELDSPLYNILGFEHAPETDAQKAALSQAENQLGRSSELFTFNSGADCKPLSETHKVTLFNVDDEDDHDDDHHDNHTDKKHHESDHDESSHKNVLLSYGFRCENPSSLSNISVNLFEFFNELSEIDATYLGPSSQKQVTLTPKNSKVEITR